MSEIAEKIQQFKVRVLEGGEVTRGEAFEMIALESESDIHHLLAAAHEITLRFHAAIPGLCSLVNAKSYLCSEDCGFCAQSARFQTQTERYRLMRPEEVLAAAKKFERAGIRDFCVVTSGSELNDAEFEQVLNIYRLLKKETRLNLDGSLGFLTAERVRALKEAGVRRINNNLQTSREFYPQIVSTHTYDKGVGTMRLLLDQGVEICSGGILNLGETREDRIRLAFELKPFHPRCLPVNILNPRPGTPLEGRPRLAPQEILKTVAVYRFIHPQANIKLAGGREYNLNAGEQIRALQGGANGLIVGGYLTTQGDPISCDLDILNRAGYEFEFQPQNETAAVSS